MAIDLNTDVWTLLIEDDTLTIDESYEFNNLSILLISGEGTFQGTKTVKEIDSVPVPMVVGLPINLTSKESNRFVKGGIIDCTAGGVIKVMGS